MGVSDLRVRLRVAWHALRGHGVAYRVTIDTRPGHTLFTLPRPAFAADITIECPVEYVFEVPDEP